MKKAWAVLTAMGTDRVGIVEELSETLESRQCNIEESKMAVLGNQFAVIMLIQGPGDEIEKLLTGRERWDHIQGITVQVRPTSVKDNPERGLSYLVETVSLDSPGIVHAITHVLRENGINIEDLDTETLSAPFTGSPMFTMSIRVTVPPGNAPASIREKLQKTAAEMDLDIKFEPVSGAR